MKKRMMIGAGMAMVAMLSSGCASYMVVQGRNSELERKAIQIQARPDGAILAVDLLNIRGYWETWKAEPAKMTGATLMDIGTAAGAAYLVNEATKSNDSKSSTPAIQNNGGTVIVNTGSGDTSYTTTTTGAAE
jgi:hypothetical protein